MDGGPRIAIDAMGGDTGPAVIVSGISRALRHDRSLQFAIYGDERVVLFVRLRDGQTLDDKLRERIRARIRRNTSPRHVPARIVQVGDVPRTRSGKIVELAVRDVVHGREVKNREALANPDALDLFRNRPELET